MQTSRILSTCVIAAFAASSLPAQDTARTNVSASGATHGAAVSTVAKTQATHSRHHVYTQAELKASAKISQDSAQRVALAEVPNGTISSVELEHEHHTTVYSFDIS